MNNWKSLLGTLVMAFIMSVSVSAQNRISGLITNSENQPLIGVNVVIKGTTIGEISNFDGRYEIVCPQDFPIVLMFSFVGYNPLEVSLETPTSVLDIVLEEGLILAEDVVISASRRAEKILDAPASVSVITARKMEASPNESPVRNLINEPGVSIQQQSAGRLNIHLRGDEGLVFGSASFPMLDYRPLGGLGDVFDILNSPISNVDLDRIEVIRGPGSALYGPGVTAGVIHFISKSPIDYPGTTVELMGGELSTYGISARHAMKTSSRFGFKVNASYKKGGEFTLNPQDPEDALKIATFINSVSAPVITNGATDPSKPPRLLLGPEDLDPDGDGNPMQDFWRSSALDMTLEFRPQNDFSIYASGGMNNSSAVFYNAVGEGLSQSTTTWLQGRMQKGGFFGEISYSYNNGGTDEHPSWLYQTGFSSGSGTWTRLFDVQLQYNHSTPQFLNAQWTAGIDYRLLTAETLNSSFGRYEQEDDYRISGGYIQGRFELLDQLDLVLATRADRFSFLDETSFAPRAVFVWKPKPKHTFRAGFNRAVAAPTQLEVNIDLPLVTIIPEAFDIWLLGNKNAQTFGDNPQIVFNGLLPFPSLPVGTPGLPLAYVQGAVSGDVIPLIAGQLASDVLLSQYISQITGYLSNTANFVGGTAGTFAGINLFNGLPLELLDAPAATLRVEDTWEFGYKGLPLDKLGLSVDIYHRKIDGATLFTGISPGYTLLNAEEIPAALNNAVSSNIKGFLNELLSPLVGGSIPDEASLQATVNQLSTLIGNAYNQSGAGFIEAISPLIEGAVLATTPTEQMPNDGVVHSASGFRTFEPYGYWGADVGLNYYVNDDLTLSGSYSWISKNDFNPKIVGIEGTEALTILQTPHKFRIGLNYVPESGIRANLNFQHDDAYNVLLGQFSGLTQTKNLVDAGVGYKFNNGLKLDLSAQNLFDNEYRTFPNFPKIGRRILARLTLSF